MTCYSNQPWLVLCTRTEQTEQRASDLADYFQKSFSVLIKILLSDACTTSQAHLI